MIIQPAYALALRDGRVGDLDAAPESSGRLSTRATWSQDCPTRFEFEFENAQAHIEMKKTPDMRDYRGGSSASRLIRSDSHKTPAA